MPESRGTSSAAAAELGPERSVRYGLWVWLAAAGILARVALAFFSIGTNDAFTFVDFARDVRLFGLAGTYIYDSGFNHPPLVGLWAAFLLKLVTPVVLPARAAYPVHVDYVFSFLFKLPPIAADAAACGLLWMIWKPRVGGVRAAAIATGFAWSLDSMLVSGFHCNTDSVYVFLCLAAAWAMDRRAFGWAGLLLGAAINVKVIPTLLIPPMLLACPGKAEARRFLYGLAACAIPFVPIMVRQFPEFYYNVLTYNSGSDVWGISFFLIKLQHTRGWNFRATLALEMFHSRGRYLLFGLIAAWGVFARLRPRWSACESAAVVFSMFLVFAPGFGVQYTVAAGLLLFAVRPRLAVFYGASAGVFLAVVYFHRLVPSYRPAYAMFLETLRPGEALLGLIPWATLLYFLVSTALRGAPAEPLPDTSNAPPPHEEHESRPLPVAA